MISNKYKELYEKFIEHYKNKHVNPWHEISENNLKEIYKNIVEKMEIVDDYSFDYFINYIIKRLSGVSDAHTQFRFQKVELLPITFKYVENKIVVYTPKELRGSELLSINNINITNIINEFEQVITYGTEGKRKYEIERALTFKNKLFSIPSLRNDETVSFKLETTEGNIITKEYNKNKKYETNYSWLINSNIIDKNATYEIKDKTIIYYHSSVQPQYEEKIKETIEKLKKEDLSNINKIIIDLRGNTGGNAALNKYLIDFLEEHKGKTLITLTDYKIFSGGRYALIDLINLGSITIGEEISTPINCYGNSSWINIDGYLFSSSEKFLFPKVVGVNSKELFKKAITEEMVIPRFYKPDININQTLEDFINKKDTIMEYAMNYEKTKTRK